MKVSKEKIKILRLGVQSMLESVPEGQRIDLEDPELLDQLLFDTYTERLTSFYKNKFPNCSSDVKVKYPVWSGPFLSKLDLSKVDFENVMWNMAYWQHELFDDTRNKFEGIKKIDYSNTNAKIDFTKSFDAILDNGRWWLIDCDFSNVDLSNNEMSGDSVAEDTNFTNTGIRIRMDEEVELFSCILNGTELSPKSISLDRFMELEYDGTNFTGTGLDITYSDDDAVDKERRESNLEKLGAEIKAGNLTGCSVNGTKILSKEEAYSKAVKARQEYLAKVRQSVNTRVFDKVEKKIAEQTKKLG